MTMFAAVGYLITMTMFAVVGYLIITTIFAVAGYVIAMRIVRDHMVVFDEGFGASRIYTILCPLESLSFSMTKTVTRLPGRRQVGTVVDKTDSIR